MTLEQITKLALKAGLFVPAAGIPEDGALMRFAHSVAKQARSEPQEKPAAWIYEFWADPGHKGLDWNPQDCADNIPLWTHPPQTKTNQCGETCERAKLCAVCLSPL